MNEDHHPVGRPLGESSARAIDRAELRKRAEEATQGEWSYLREPGMVVCTLGRATPVPVFLRGSMAKHEDGQFAAAAQPQVVLALLDRIDELEGALAPFAESEGVPESACTYCGDYSHDARRCRAGAHNFELTGDEVHTFNKEQIEAARKALSGEKP